MYQILYIQVTGLKALGVRDLTYRLGFLASSAAQSSSDVGGQYDIRADEDDVDIAAQFSPDERDEIMRMKEQNELYVEAIILYLLRTLYVPFIHLYYHLYYHIYTYVHPLYMYIQSHIHHTYTERTSKHPINTLYTPHIYTLYIPSKRL